MGKLVDFIASMIVFFLLMCLIAGIKIHTLDETHMDKSFNIKDRVYILPDSTIGMIESGYVFTSREKNKVTKVKKDVTFSELYTIIYTDKNGVIQRIKKVKPEMLIRKNEY